MRLRRFRVDSFDALRKRMIAETELALLVGLRFPDRMPRIPTMEVGSGRFHPDFATRYWSQTLDVDMAELVALEEACDPPRLIL